MNILTVVKILSSLLKFNLSLELLSYKHYQLFNRVICFC